MNSCYIGPAGWAYDDWEGIVYPSEKPPGFDRLEYCSRFFNCVEVNSTFYHIPAPQVTEGWATRVKRNRHFRFTVKLYRDFTHENARAGKNEADAFRRALVPLEKQGRLGAVLMQFPWSFKNTPANRNRLDRLMVAFETLPLVVEVRHASWNIPPFYEYLRERGVGFCNIDQPLFRGSLEASAVSTGPTGYIRLHGRNRDDWFRNEAGRDERYNYLYSMDELAEWNERIDALRADSEVIYVITNNHYKGKAVCNALELAARSMGGLVPVPPVLLRTYPRLRAIAASPPGQGEFFFPV